MQSEEDRLSNFLGLVFKRMRNGNSYFVLEDTENAETADGKLVSEFRKKVNLISVALKDIHFVDLNFFSDVFILDRRNIFTLLTFHCFKICQDFDNIFFAFMYTCSYVSFALNFFEEKGLEQFSTFNCMCTREIFEHRIKESFEEQGGWAGLESFATAPNLPHFIDFFCSCFTDNMKLHTPIYSNQGVYHYGLRYDTSTYRKAFSVLEKAIITSYHKDLERSHQYLIEVLSSFKRARTALEQSLGLTDQDPNQVRGYIVNISHINVSLFPSDT